MATKFSKVYNTFLAQITDDLYMELTPEDTMKDMQSLLIRSIPEFEFPRKVLTAYTISTEWVALNEVESDDFVLQYEYEPGPGDEPIPVRALIDNSSFTADLTDEEIYILALIMKCGWVQRQVTSIENTRMKYSGVDFKMSSQANHLAKLLSLLKESQRHSFHMQRLYKRRKVDENGNISSNWGCLREVSALDD